MTTRATILPGDAASPVVLHVPHCPPMPTELTPRMLLDGSLDAPADRIAQQARRLAARRPHVVLNRIRSDLDDLALSEPVGGYRQICAHHNVMLSAPLPASYVSLVSDIVDERVADAGRAVVIEIRTTSDESLTDVRPRIVLRVDPDLTPPSLTETAASAFAAYDVVELEGSAARHHHDLPSATIAAMTIDVCVPSIADVAPEEILGLSRPLATVVDASLDG